MFCRSCYFYLSNPKKDDILLNKFLQVKIKTNEKAILLRLKTLKLREKND
jgi:hypothetical protein